MAVCGSPPSRREGRAGRGAAREDSDASPVKSFLLPSQAEQVYCSWGEVRGVEGVPWGEDERVPLPRAFPLSQVRKEDSTSPDGPHWTLSWVPAARVIPQVAKDKGKVDPDPTFPSVPVASQRAPFKKGSVSLCWRAQGYAHLPHQAPTFAELTPSAVRGWAPRFSPAALLVPMCTLKCV